MDKKEAIKWVVDTKAISAFTKNFVKWLYENGYMIVKQPKIVEKWHDCLDEYKNEI